MKAKYIQPEIMVSKIETESLMAASNPNGYNDSLSNDPVNGSSALSAKKGFTSIWGEDDDE